MKDNDSIFLTGCYYCGDVEIIYDTTAYSEKIENVGIIFPGKIERMKVDNSKYRCSNYLIHLDDNRDIDIISSDLGFCKSLDQVNEIFKEKINLSRICVTNNYERERKLIINKVFIGVTSTPPFTRFSGCPIVTYGKAFEKFFGTFTRLDFLTEDFNQVKVPRSTLNPITPFLPQDAGEFMIFKSPSVWLNYVLGNMEGLTEEIDLKYLSMIQKLDDAEDYLVLFVEKHRS